MIAPLLIGLVLAFIFALIAVPLVRMTCVRFNLIDRPDRVRKLQTTPVALGGGIAVFMAMLAAFGGTIILDRLFFDQTIGNLHRSYYQLFAAAAALLMIGFVDDLFALRGRQKLLAQILIISALVGGGTGTLIQTLGLFGFNIPLGMFAFPITVLWLVVAINALNLIDGADGMAGTVGAIVCLGLGVMSYIMGSPLNAVVCFGLAGALAGFLCFNRPPATIYLGDAGSMMIGLLVGVLAIWTDLKDYAVLSSTPIAILTIPLFDSSAAILRRWLTGRSIYATDRGHLHHLLQEKFGLRGMLGFVIAICSFTTIIGILSAAFAVPWLSGVGVLLVIGGMVASGVFGSAEFNLVAHRVLYFGRSFVVRPGKVDQTWRRTNVQLQGGEELQTIWEPLVAFAQRESLAAINLDLNLAWLQEGYHGHWKSERMPEKAMQMSVNIPVFVENPTSGQTVTVGTLRVIAAADDPTLYEHLARLGDFLQDFNQQLNVVVRDIHDRRVLVHPSTLPSGSA